MVSSSNPRPIPRPYLCLIPRPHPSPSPSPHPTLGGGFVLFDEFCKWAISKALDLEEDDDFDGAEVERFEAVGYAAERRS